MTKRTVFAVAALCAACFVQTPIAAPQQARTGAHQVIGTKETSGGMVYTLVPVHGTWSADYEKTTGDPNLRQILTLDGMTKTPTAPNPVDAKALWGAEGDAFLKAATAPGAFPIAIARDLKGLKGGTFAVDFKLVAGQTDQSAGIAFNIQPDGSYYFARYNTKDGNVAVWKFENGTRTVLAHGTEHEQLKLGEWHTLEVRLSGKTIQATANRKLSVTHTIDVEPSGRVGVWAKNDSVTSFRHFRFLGHPHVTQK